MNSSRKNGQEGVSGQEAGRTGGRLVTGQVLGSWTALMIFLLAAIYDLNAKIDMRRQFSIQNLAARDSMASATSDSNLIKWKTEVKEE